jgi:DNA polymerase-1
MIITNLKELEKWCESITDILEFDVETTGLSFDCPLTSIQLGNGKEEIFIPLGQKECLTIQEIQPLLKEIFSKPSVKVAHNIKFDAKILQSNGVPVAEPYFDTMVAFALVYPDYRRKSNSHSSADRFGLKPLMLEFFGIESLGWKEYLNAHPLPYEHTTPKGKKSTKYRKPTDLSELPLNIQEEYAVKDIIYTRKLKEFIEPRMSVEAKWIFENVEMPVVPILVQMELDGILIDQEINKRLYQSFQDKCKQAEDKIYALAKKKFDIASPQQLREVLRYDFQVPLCRLTPKKELSTDNEALEPFIESYEICKQVLEYRKYSKGASFCAQFLELVKSDGRLHSTFGITATGRMTSEKPNLQQLPKDDEDLAELRKAFITKPGHKIIDVDYSQMEIFMVAHLSQDPNLIKDLNSGADLHLKTAMLIWGDPEKRGDAKTINFGVLFGKSRGSLANDLKVSYTEADRIFNKIFLEYPEVLRMHKELQNNVEVDGVVKTILGRTRNLHLAESDKHRRANMALNTPVQSSCADLVKVAMIRVNKELRKRNLKTRMICQIHDELLFEAPEEEIYEVSRLVEGCMESISIVKDVYLLAPMRVEVSVKDSWGEKEVN